MTKSNNIYLILTIALIIFNIKTEQTDSIPQFADYVIQFNKNYDNAQYHQRQLIYNYNVKYIKQSNCKSFGVNIFTDWSQNQMKKLKGGFQANLPVDYSEDQINIQSSGMTLTNQSAPASYDWRDFKAVTPVKNQLNCGACWAYSTTAFFQSDLIVSNNYTNEIDLSQQFLLKCDNKSLKCDGGFLFWAMQRVIETYGGMPTERQYPYNYSSIWKQDGMCYQTDLIKIDQNRKLVSFYEVQDINFIQKLLLKKPINVNICSKDLQYYSPKPDFRTLSCTSNQTNRDHTVLLVGYTQTQWIIKNQWSSNWGSQGFAYISKQPANDCCIGKQLFTTGTISQKCSVDNCQICVQQTSCFRCKQGYYVKNLNSTHICKQCFQTGCLKCVNYYGVCETCMEGYSVTYPTYRCMATTIDNCSFMYNDLCSQCRQGYVLTEDGKCISEDKLCYVAHCSACVKKQPNICQACIAGYDVNPITYQCDTKIPCSIPNCIRCSSQDSQICQICQMKDYEFSLSQKKCVPICKIQGCSNCVIQNDNSKLCSECRKGYQLTVDNKTCQKCSVKYCVDCSINPSGSCQTCAFGYYLNKQKCLCFSCSQITHCTSCNIDQNSNITCSKCSAGFTPSKDGKSCLKCLANCAICQYSSLQICSSNCGLMNYLSSQKTCQSCQQNCYSCIDINQCKQCLDGYTLDKGYCYPTYKQGNRCGEWYFSPQGSICLQCKLGYQMINSSCVFDPSYDCLQQNGLNPLGCGQCPQKYYLRTISTRKICTRCNISDSNCIGCLQNSPNACSKCADSYYVSDNRTSCLKCQDFDTNCRRCDYKNLCKQCKTGYFVVSVNQNDESLGICQKCNQNCVTCKYNPQFCLSCKQGYLLSVNRQCLRKVGIRFTIVIDADYNQLVNQILIDIYDYLAKIWNLSSTKDIQIVSIQSGSIKIVGNLRMPENQYDSSAFLQNKKKILSSQQNIGPYPILSSNVEFLSTSGTTKLTEVDKLSTGAIIGVAAGGAVFAISFIILLGIGIKRFICNKNPQKQKVKKPNKNKQKRSKQKSAISTQPSSRKNSIEEVKKKLKRKLNDDTQKYINDQVTQTINDGKGNPVVI